VSPVPGSSLGDAENEMVDMLAPRLLEFKRRKYFTEKVERQDARNLAREIVRNVAAVLEEK
jgi:predicted secreted protein